MLDRKSNNNKKYVIFSSSVALLSVALGIIVVFEHQKLKELESRLLNVESGNDVTRVRRHVDEYIKNTNTKRSLTESIKSEVEPFIRELFDSSVKNLEKLCGDSSKICLPGPQGPKGDRGPRGQPGSAGAPPTTACCERLIAPVIKGPLYEEITATYNIDILLPCEPNVGYPTPLVFWNTTVLGTFINKPNGLFIPKAQAHHEGHYECTISNIFGTSTKKIDLKVKGKITVNVTIPAKAFVDGNHESARLVCDYTGVPLPSISWRHIGLDGTNATVTNNVVTIGYQSVLTFSDLVFLHSGVYICTASNRYETVVSYGVLEVQAKPYMITSHFRNLSVIKGKDLILECTVVSNPIAAITWKLPEISGHTPFNVFDNGDGSITIRDAQQINEGDYTCIASNSYGNVNATSTVDVLEPVTVQIVQARHRIGDPNVNFIALDCRAKGDPQPTLKWDKLGTVLDRKESRYIFLDNGDFIISSVSNATSDIDSGVYTCTASNSHSSNTAYGIIYYDHADVDCNTKFEDFSSKLALAHRAKCPLDCLSKSGEIYGSGPYSMNSPICKSAVHKGVLGNSGNQIVLWYTSLGTNANFQGTTKNGVTTHTSGPLFDAASILDISTGLYPKVKSTSHVIG
ncbi:hypothetical protein LOTGIDRAFT_173198 [Lottia gigantea]|uniref:Ig-like domain-containing protein n=1 Tax=Lottia gigantea TaxID=225164 RepID=V4B295_LOTGI|nr:hypothetical protein LOTGIDRAFT_173198 [Lottia gigantea]ESP00392.1 hypothetical protein LOTGIDRAFT_173198 [Lottia gigantea]